MARRSNAVATILEAGMQQVRQAAREHETRKRIAKKAPRNVEGQPVELHTLPAGAKFHIPATGQEGSVEYHSSGSSTVTISKFEHYTSLKKPTAKELKLLKKGDAEPLPTPVEGFRTKVERTQIALGTSVIPGLMPETVRKEHEERVYREAGSQSPEIVVPAPEDGSKARVRRVVPEKPAEKIVIAPRSGAKAQWPVQVNVRGGVLKGCAKKLTAHNGISIAEEKKTGAGSAVTLEVASPTAAAFLLSMLNRKESRKTCQRTAKALAAMGMDVRIREGAYVVEGEEAK